MKITAVPRGSKTDNTPEQRKGRERGRTGVREKVSYLVKKVDKKRLGAHQGHSGHTPHRESASKTRNPTASPPRRQPTSFIASEPQVLSAADPLDLSKERSTYPSGEGRYGESKYSQWREKMADTTQQVGVKRASAHHPVPDRETFAIPLQHLERLNGDVRQSGLKPFTECRQGDEGVHSTKKVPDLHLPTATQDFLDVSLPPRPSSRSPPTERNTIFTPSDTVTMPDRHVPETPRPRRCWSSNSRYSDSASDGTVKSAEDAEQLLATADSGPSPPAQKEYQTLVIDKGREDDDDEEMPSDDELRRAEDVLITEEIKEVKAEEKRMRRKLGEV